MAGLLPKIAKWSTANVMTMHNPPPLPGERTIWLEFFADPDTGIDAQNAMDDLPGASPIPVMIINVHRHMPYARWLQRGGIPPNSSCMSSL